MVALTGPGTERISHRGATVCTVTGMHLTCPKCAAAMRQYERNGIVVDQCSACRAVLLDRGELEHLIDTEKWVNNIQPGAPAGPMPGYQGEPDTAQTMRLKERRTLLQILFGD
jgi:Zn-finger nucleic acid-binding protein